MKKSGVLYEHSDMKSREFLSVGKIFRYMAKKLNKIYENFGKLNTIFEKPKEPKYTREDGIDVILGSFNIIRNEFKKIAYSLNDLAKQILDKEESFKSKAEPTKMCDDSYKKYDYGLNRLANLRKLK